MAFDPDQYLQEKQPSDGFDPDAYLADKTGGASSKEMSLKGLGQNAISDVKDIASSIPSTIGQMAMIPKTILVDQPNNLYQTGKQMIQGQPFSSTPIGQQAQQFGSMIKQLPENVIHPYEHPVKAAMDAATMGSMGANAYSKVRPLLAPIGKSIADVAEKGSGLTYKTPGVLADTFQMPSKLFAPGVEKAREIYGETETGVRPGLSGEKTHQDFVDKALDMAKSGDITPTEALEARKSLDRIRKTVPGSYYRAARETLDGIAKKDFAIADKVYGQGVKSDNMRNLFPLNKGGTPSLLKMGVGTMAKGAIPLLSPLVQSSLASGAGALDKLATTTAKSGILNGTAAANLATTKSGNQLNNNLQADQEENTPESPKNPFINTGDHAASIPTSQPLTKQKAREFLDQANGDRDLARKLAAKAGYSW